MKKKYHKTICWCVLKKHQLQWIKILCDLCCYYWEMTLHESYVPLHLETVISICVKRLLNASLWLHYELLKTSLRKNIYIFLFSHHHSELRVLMHFSFFLWKIEHFINSTRENSCEIDILGKSRKWEIINFKSNLKWEHLKMHLMLKYGVAEIN